MTRSMTGFGRSVTQIDGEQVTIEISSVNHRFLEFSFRLPPSWTPLETPLRELIKQKISRGKVNVSIRREYGPMGRVRVRLDEEVVRAYADASRRLADLLNSTESISLDRIATLEGVFARDEDGLDLESVQAQLSAGLEEALAAFNNARETEGASLARDMAARLELIDAAVGRVEARMPGIVQVYRARLWERMAEICAETGVKEERLAVEAAIMADRMDVTEEMVRLRTHLRQGLKLLEASEPVGRDYNFLLQEMQREINTMGSKMRDADGIREVLLMKSELEKLREQLQNIE